MNISTTPFNVLSVDRDKGEVHLGMSEARPIPQDIECGQTVYPSTDKPACPRTSDMQDLVDRCEAKTKPPEKGWRKVMRNDIAYIVDENDKGVAMIPATWWLMGQTDEERAAELHIQTHLAVEHIKPKDLNPLLERTRQETWDLAQLSLSNLQQPGADNPHMRNQVALTAATRGGFGIWFAVFRADHDMLLRLIAAFLGSTAECFDHEGEALVRPGGGL